MYEDLICFHILSMKHDGFKDLQIPILICSQIVFMIPDLLEFFSVPNLKLKFLNFFYRVIIPHRSVQNFRQIWPSMS
jgi:hypothetical protein